MTAHMTGFANATVAMALSICYAALKVTLPS